MPPNPRTEPSHMDVDSGMTGSGSGEGLKTYYITKIEELMLTVTDKRQDVRRLQVLKKIMNVIEFQFLNRHSYILICFPGSAK